MPRYLSKLYKCSFVYLRELFGIFCWTESTWNKKLQHFCVSLYVKIMASLLLCNDKFTRCTKTFLNPYTVFKNTKHSKPHRNLMEEFCQRDYLEKNENNQTSPFSDFIFLLFSGTSFSLWCFPSFLKLLYSVSDSLSELLVLENCGGNCRVFSLVDILILDINLRKQ